MVVILIFELNCLHTIYSAKGRAVYDSSSRIIFNSITQLYEQGADPVRIGQYVLKWLQWVRTGNTCAHTVIA
jgi:hypothetical protein